MDEGSGVGVLDKAMALLRVVGERPASLADLVAGTGISRPTAHRLALALEHHAMLGRDERGRFVVGPLVGELGGGAGGDALVAAAGPVLLAARDATAESAQLYRRRGSSRVCVAAAERPGHGLRDSVPVGAVLTMTAGSAAQVLLAWEPDGPSGELPADATFAAADLAAVRRRGWAQSAGQREAGVASVSAPVRGPGGAVVAALSVSGPMSRLGRTPGRTHAEAVLRAAAALEAATA